MRGINDEGVADVLAWCLERGYSLRFIEQMPLDAQHGWERARMVTADEILARLTERFDLAPVPASERGAARPSSSRSSDTPTSPGAPRRWA